MKTRLVSAAALVGALAVSLSGAQAAATPVLDGKKVTTLSVEATPAAQSNDKDLASIDGPERVACSAPRCVRLPFVYKPAKGVKGNLAFSATWSVPAEDYDLYVAEIAKDGSATEIAHCGATVGTSEKIQLGTDAFKPGKTYALIIDFYRASGSQKVTGKVSFPGSADLKTPVPAAVDELQPTNCGL